MTAVALALASAALFGGMTVTLRAALNHRTARGTGDVKGGTAATAMIAFAVVLVAALVRHDPGGAVPFLLAGLLAPGGSQILFTLAIREAGASRTSVTVGAAPLVAVALALLFLDEPLRLPLAVGAMLIVAGAIALAGERDRPAHVNPRGLLYAVAATVFFAVRDDVVRALHGHACPETAAAATLATGTVVSIAFARRLPTRDELRRFAPPGIFFGLSYVCLFEAYFRGRVSVVSPLVATESLWGVALSAVVFRHTEGVGRRLAIGALLVVAGGALIGAFR